MKLRSVKVYAPASIGNLGSGFDVLGIALQNPGDFALATRTREPGLQFRMETTQSGLPTDAKNNIAAHVANLMIRELNINFGINLILYKNMPVGSGLGSSAASSVAAAMAVNSLLTKPLKKMDLLRFVIEGERKASGSGHADNVAPSLLGGGCIIRDYNPLDVIPLTVSKKIIWVVVHPHLIISTHEARGILPTHLPLKTAVQQWGNVSALTMGLINGNVELVGKAITDVVAEPVRANLLTGFHDVKAAALRAGALGCTFSGSGPSMFAVASSLPGAKRIADAMINCFENIAKVQCESYISRVNATGAKIIWQKEG